MVGYETEDKAFALEVTYNYGIDEYDTGTGLQSIAISVDDVDAAVAAAEQDKWEVTRTEDGGAMIVGPDEYRYLAVPKASVKKGRAEPFVGVSLAVADVAKATAFYTSVLNMKALEGKGSDSKVVLGYSADQVPITLTATEGGKAPEISQWEGRNAFSMPAELVQSVYKLMEAEYPSQIIHEMQILDEKLGKLFIAIVRDVDGYELCLVSSETFDPAVLEAADFQVRPRASDPHHLGHSDTRVVSSIFLSSQQTAWPRFDQPYSSCCPRARLAPHAARRTPHAARRTPHAHRLASARRCTLQEPNWPKRAHLLKETQEALKAEKREAREGADGPFSIGGMVNKFLHPKNMTQGELNFLLCGVSLGFGLCMVINLVSLAASTSKRVVKAV